MRSHFKKFKIYYLLGGLIFILLSLLFFYQKFFFKKAPEIGPAIFELKPTIADAAGIAPETSFILKSKIDLSPDVIKKYLKFEPEIKYQIKKIKGGSSIFEITPAEPLAENTVYSIVIPESPIATRTYSWAYQVKAPFQVIGTLPSDKAVFVPTNTVIEITFNRENLVNPERFFEILPHVSGRFEVHRNTLIFIPSRELNPKTVYTVKIKSGIKVQGSNDTLSEDKIIQFETTEKYSPQPTPYFEFTKTFWEFKPNSEVVFGVSYSNIPKNTVGLAVYQFENAQEFILAYISTINKEYLWTSYNAFKPSIPPSGKKVFEANVLLEKKDETQFIRLPQRLKDGFYLANVVVNGVYKQAWFQISPIAGFLAVSAPKTLVWVKNLNDGSNIPGAQISFENKIVGKTNSDGVAIFETPLQLIQNKDDLNSYHPLAYYFFVIFAQGKELVVPIESERGYFSKVTPPDKWWDYLSLNKNIFLPTDKIYFWGIVKQRNGSDIRGKEVTVELTEPFWYESAEEEITVYAQAKAKISDFYTLTGEISFSDLKPGVYQLSVKWGKEIIVSEIVNVESYMKPSYRILLTPDRNVIFAGENINFKAKAEFFDGTPVANLRLKYEGYLCGDQISGEVKLNENGEGSFTVKTDYKEGCYLDGPEYLGINIFPAVAEEGEISSSTSVLVFGSRINLQSEQSFSEKKSKFILKLSNVVLDEIEKGGEWWNFDDYLGGPVPDWKIKANVEEIIYKKEEIGREYDPINKVTYPIYQYLVEYEPKKEDILFTDKNGNAYYEWMAEEGKSYRITFLTEDPQGRLAMREHYVYGESFSYFDFYHFPEITLANLNNKWKYKLGEEFYLQMQDQGKKAIPPGPQKFLFVTLVRGTISYQISDSPDYIASFKEEYIPNVEIIGVWFSGLRFVSTNSLIISFDSEDRRLNIDVKADKERYLPGDKVNLEIKVTDKKGLPKEAEVNISGIDEAVFSLSPEEKDIIDVLYQDISSSILIRTSHYTLFREKSGAEMGCFLPGTKILTPEGMKNIETLRVGDEVLTWEKSAPGKFVRTKIKKVSSHIVDGYFVINNKLKVTPNHRILVNGLWKEAGRIKIGDTLLTKEGKKEKVTSLEFILKRALVYNIELEKYHAYFANGIFVHNEEKEGGEPRAKFREVAIFKSIRTDSNGQAKVSFELPDNLTSWRLTFQATSKDLFAGKKVIFLPVSLPFFVETTLNRTYLAGDNLVLRLRVFGSSDVKENILYRVECDTLPFKRIEKVGGKIIEIPLGTLIPGEHQIKISAKTSNYSDAIIRELNVLTSYFSETTSEFYELSPGLSNIKGSSRGYTTLLFSSYERGRFYSVLREIKSAAGARIDQKLASWLARSYLKKFFDEEIEIEEADFKEYQTSNGGITLFPYSDEDLELSAKVASLIKKEEGIFDKESLKQYFYESLADRKADLSRISLALYGLSAFREPILVTIQNIKNNPNLTLMDKIYLALAFNNLGAKEEARAYYIKEIKPALTIKRPFVYLSTLQSQDENILATALLAGLSASLSEPESDGLGEYAIKNYPKRTLKNFEILLYLSEVLPKLKGSKVSFSWNTSERSGTKTLEKDEVFRLQLSPEELSTLRFSNVEGRIGLVSIFEKEVSPEQIERDPNIKVVRTYSVDGRSATEFGEGDLVRIDITASFAPGALEGSYQVVDYLPSGLRAVTGLQRTPIWRGGDYHIYPSFIEDQKVTFIIWKDFAPPLFYYARVVSKGEYKAEPVLVQSLESLESKNISNEAKITIR